MICCNYISNNDEVVRYAYGGDSTDITGIIEFNVDLKYFTKIKKQENSYVSMRSINRLIGKYRSDFLKRVFKEKIAFES